jgi:alpha-1,3-glucan synthase
VATPLAFYMLNSVFLAASIVWYTLFRPKPFVYTLVVPSIFLVLAFFLIGVPALFDSIAPYHRTLGSAAP